MEATSRPTEAGEEPEFLGGCQDWVLLVVHPELGEDAPVFGSASVYGALPGTPPDRSGAAEAQGWVELGVGNFLVPWLLHLPSGRSPTDSRHPPSSTEPWMVMAGQQTPDNRIPPPPWQLPSASASACLGVVGRRRPAQRWVADVRWRSEHRLACGPGACNSR
jgi:hypothetical protein